MNNIWKRKQELPVLECRMADGVPYLSFPMLEKTGIVRHGFSTRMGGVSTGVYATMNFAFLKGDDPDHVRENYRRMAKAIGVDEERMVLSWQTHTTNIRRVTEDDAGKGITRERDYQDIDGLITDVPGMTLVTFYADCVPLYFLDPVHRAIGLSHSGWRGTVGEEVAAEFRRAFSEEYWPELLREKPNGKLLLNLWRANEIVLLEAGVKADNIQITDICTHCNPDYLFSHRTMGNERGNLAAFLSIKES